MIFRADLALWGLAAALAVAAGAAHFRAAWRGRRAAALGFAALAAIAAGLAWRDLPVSAWPGTSVPDAEALAAAGALACALWAEAQGWPRRPRRGPGAGDGEPAAEAEARGVAFGLAGLLALAALLAGWGTFTFAPPFAARTWLFGLWAGLAALGLGGALCLGAAALWSTLLHLRAALPWRRRRSPRRPAAADQPEAGGAAPGEPHLGGNGVAPAGEGAARSDAHLPALAVAGAVVAPAVAAPATQEPGSAGLPAPAAAPLPAGPAELHFAGHALRFMLFWLTAALLGGVVWSLAAYAVPWRGRPGEIWPAVTWLFGAACLHLFAGGRTPRLSRPWAWAAAVLGLAAAILAALQMPSVLS